jgi:hypothetical protein
VTEQGGKHVRRRALVRHFDEYVDAAYTPIGQRAVKLAIAAAAVLAVNLVLLVLLLVHVL